MKLILVTCMALIIHFGNAQNYTYFFSGDTTDVSVVGTGGVCIMGGGTEDDNAMVWFLNKAELGNVLVLRASGGDGYQDYFFNQLGVNLASVETIVMNNANCGSDAFVLDRIAKADAIWFAGGDQFLYTSYLKGSAAEDALNYHINTEKQVIGGTSAGMAIQGDYFFDAQNGTITSQTALNNPYDPSLSLNTDFLENEFMQDLITETHFTNPDRKGRLSTFLARLVHENQRRFFAIACQDYTAVCIEDNGIARVFGGAPTYDDKVYFIQTNCEGAGYPELITANQPLSYVNEQKALHVMEMEATESGQNTFDLTDWISHNGGVWKNWYVENGQLFETAANAPNCALSLTEQDVQNDLSFDVTNGYIELNEMWDEITLFSTEGKTIRRVLHSNRISIAELDARMVLIKTKNRNGNKQAKCVINY